MTILEGLQSHARTLGILIDPEKLELDGISAFAKAISQKASLLMKKFKLDEIHLLVGGSTMENVDIDEWMGLFQQHTHLKVLLFPGSAHQITNRADGILFINLISGRNPEYLIGQHIEAAPKLAMGAMEILPTAYILIDGGRTTAVQRVSQTLPLPAHATNEIVNTAMAGQFMGNQLIYLEAGSGALNAVSSDTVRLVAQNVTIPIIVGGGLKTADHIEERFEAGAHMVVVGTAIEQDLKWIG